MCSAGEGSASTRTTPLSTVDVSESCAEVGTTPGQSMRYILRVRVMYCQTYLKHYHADSEIIIIIIIIIKQTLVSPGMGATRQTLLLLIVLITLLFPTFGYPTNPTDICFLSECSCANWRSNCMREPLPKEWFGEAWNAMVGYRGIRCWIYRAYRMVIKNHHHN